MPCARAPPGYSLVDTLIPSFTLSLFRLTPQGFRKSLGVCKGCILWQDEDTVCCEGCRYDELLAWSGLWLTSSVNLAEFSEDLVIGLSVSPWDLKLIFSSVFLSRNTMYERVLRWMRAIGEAIEASNYRTIEEYACIAGSYQVRQLVRALRLYDDAMVYAAKSIWDMRRRLLSLPNVGVKTAHATILFSTFASVLFPVDRHLARRVKGRAPDKRLCAKYACPQCPAKGSCIVWRLYRRFGRLAGLYQTIVWLKSIPRSRRSRLLDAVREDPL